MRPCRSDRFQKNNYPYLPILLKSSLSSSLEIECLYSHKITQLQVPPNVTKKVCYLQRCDKIVYWRKRIRILFTYSTLQITSLHSSLLKQRHNREVFQYNQLLNLMSINYVKYFYSTKCTMYTQNWSGVVKYHFHIHAKNSKIQIDLT